MANKQGFFRWEILIMSVLLEKDCYGYEISSIIKKLSNSKIDIKDGTMYPILLKLSEKKYVSTRNETVGNKIRVYYHLESLGKIYLEEMLNEYNEMIKAIDNVINHIE